MGFPKISFRVCETRHCPLFRYGDVFQISGIAISMESNGENSFINTTMVHSPPNRGSCKILNGDLTKIIIEYERADQIPDCMLSCSGCTGSIRLEHFRTMHEADEPDNIGNHLGGILHLFSWFLLLVSIFFVIQSVLMLKQRGGYAQRAEMPANYSFENTVRVVEEGLYRYIRHPMYSSLLFLGWGAFLKHVTPVNSGLIVVVSVFIIAVAKVEERENVRFFGAAYVDYKQRTRMFIPWVF